MTLLVTEYYCLSCLIHTLSRPELLLSIQTIVTILCVSFVPLSAFLIHRYRNLILFMRLSVFQILNYLTEK